MSCRSCSARPNPDIVKRNTAMVELIIGQRLDAAAGHAKATHVARAKELLQIDTGDWGDTQHLTHHCGGIQCCRGGIVETRAKLWLAIVAARLR